MTDKQLEYRVGMTMERLVARARLRAKPGERYRRGAAGIAQISDIKVAFYWETQRAAWFNANGRITKKEAVVLLVEHVKKGLNGLSG